MGAFGFRSQLRDEFGGECAQRVELVSANGGVEAGVLHGRADQRGACLRTAGARADVDSLAAMNFVERKAAGARAASVPCTA